MIRKLLVANRGEIARRIIRSAHAMDIACVAVCSDADATAPHGAEADEVVRLAGSQPAETYLRADALVAAAVRSGADAVHPGYGFLSEDAAFARACGAAGLVFVGPPPEVIEAMGSKLAAKATMAGAGVPVLPTVRIAAGTVDGHHAGSALVEGNLEGGPIEHKLVEGNLVEAAAELGWPVLVKASAGGGGRGMRVVEGPGDLADAVASAAREAAAAFGDGTVFLEPYVARPRHVEVQILGDTHGTVVHLFERECSIQRRHQKIVEESPSPALSPELRAEMCATAVTAARAIGYVGAGTVEFLLLPDGTFAFLEVNTRLQVEHPVTELVTGLDLVRLQLLVAEGQAAAPRGHRRRGSGATPSRSGSTPRTPPGRGNPRPAACTVSRSPADGGVRVDSGVEDGSEVSPYYDPMLAKVIAHGPTRDDAARMLAGALDRAQIHGVTTNRDLLVRILRHGGVPERRHRHRLPPAPRPGRAGQRRRPRPRSSGSTPWPPRWPPRRRDGQQAPVLARPALGMAQQPVAAPGVRLHRALRPASTSATASTAADAARGVGRRRPAGPMSRWRRCRPGAVVLAVGGVARRYRRPPGGPPMSSWTGPTAPPPSPRVPRFALPGSQLAAGALVAPLPGDGGDGGGGGRRRGAAPATPWSPSKP